MIKAVIFDMDGVLIDSEPVWQQMEIDVFRDIGIELTPELQVDTKGLRTDEMVNYWYSRYPWKGDSVEEVMKRYDGGMEMKFQHEVKLFDGARDAIETLYNQGMPLALASSSTMTLINIFLDRFGFREYFSVVHSSEHEKYGKPHPAVFLETARLLDTDPTCCLVVEDSFHGLIAAKAARMRVIIFPDDEDLQDPRFNAADLKISHLRELSNGLPAELLS